MPPKAKFSKEEIIEAAINIVRLTGLEGLTARALGAALGSSARPIFTVFQNMDEINQAVVKSAKALYSEYTEKGLLEENPFKGVGMAYISFAEDEPKLFQILFMAEQSKTPMIDTILLIIEENYEKILSSIKDRYDLNDTCAQRLYHHLWIYTHGIASLCATKMCSFKKIEIDEMITDVAVGLLIKMKAGSKND